jgi:hypothetical protein
MSKEALHATRKHTSGINDLRAEISKLKATLATEEAKSFDMTKEQSSNSKPRPQAANVRTQRRRPARISWAFEFALWPRCSCLPDVR